MTSARCSTGVKDAVATGLVLLSVAALMKAHLTEVNHVALLDAVAGKTLEGAREVLATWFRRADVLPSIRKLPASRASTTRSRGATPAAPSCPLFEWAAGSEATHVYLCSWKRPGSRRRAVAPSRRRAVAPSRPSRRPARRARCARRVIAPAGVLASGAASGFRRSRAAWRGARRGARRGLGHSARAPAPCR